MGEEGSASSSGVVSFAHPASACLRSTEEPDALRFVFDCILTIVSLYRKRKEAKGDGHGALIWPKSNRRNATTAARQGSKGRRVETVSIPLSTRVRALSMIIPVAKSGRYGT